MKHLLKLIIAILALSSLTACVVVPAADYDRPYYRYHHHHYHDEWDRRW